jgi:nucleoside-diphosphate-sugar epimerase
VHYLNSLDAINTSNKRVRDMIQGNAKDQLPPTGTFIWVDVRDVALAHVRAMEVPDAGGQRFFVTAGHYSNKDIADIIREAYPELVSKLPADATSDMPADIFQVDNSKTTELLGLKYRPLKQSVADTVKSLLAVGA